MRNPGYLSSAVDPIHFMAELKNTGVEQTELWS